MEKFAVDLEKVLDEFEYNEEREENNSFPSIRKTSLPHMGFSAHRQLPIGKPPAASYRRPSFEPINLADANFAASPPKPQSSIYLPDTQNECSETYSFFGNNSQLNNRNCAPIDDVIVSPFNNNVNSNDESKISSDNVQSHIWDNSSNIVSEEKPDLLEYNTMHLNIHPNRLENNSQLPDLTTSVRSSTHIVNNNGLDHLSDSLDLISSTTENLHFDDIENSHTKKNLLTCKNDSEGSESNLIMPSNIHDTNINVNHESICENLKHTVPLPSLDQIDDEKLTVDSSINEELLADKFDTHQDDINQNAFTIKSHIDQTSNMVSDNAKVTEAYKTSSVINNDIINAAGTDIPTVPISFDNDTELTENEINDYLQELDELDESSNFNEDFIRSDVTLMHKIENESSLNNQVVNGDSHDTGINESCTADHNNENAPSKSIAEFQNESKETTPLNVELTGKESTLSKLQSNQGCNYSSESNKSDVSSNREKLPSISNANVEHKVIMQTSVVEIAECKEEHIDECSLSQVSLADEERDNEKNVYVESQLESSNPFCDADYDNMPSTETTDSRLVCTDDSVDDYSCDDVSSVESDDLLRSEELSTDTIPCEEISNIRIYDKDSSKPDDSSINNEFPDKKVKTASESVISPDDLVLEIDSNVNTSGVVSLYSEEIYNQTTNEVDQNLSNSKTESGNVGDMESEYVPSCSKANNNELVEESKVKMIPIKMSTESSEAHSVDEAGIPAEEDKPLRPSSLELPRKITVETNTVQSPTNTGQLVREIGSDDQRLGKIPPFWIPDAEAPLCMQCQIKFSVIKRRHHCRACGQVLCYKCCGLKARLEYMNFAEARVCQPCFTVLDSVFTAESTSSLRRQPNPNNPMEYCSTIPPLQQAAGSLHQPPPSVMVPVGVLKREGRSKSEVTKKVMFSDGIRPGGDLTELDGSVEPRMPFRRPGRFTKRVGTPPGGAMSSSLRRIMDPTTHSFIPAEGDNSLPPLISRSQGELSYSDLESPISLDQPIAKFALNRNLYVSVKRVLLDCCVNRECWCISSEGLACVGQDEIVVLLECLPQESFPPKDIFLLINHIYQEASKGSTVSEMSFTPALSNNMLGSRDHGGFLYIRTSYQCTAHLVLPSPPYLVALLIHRWETPWARLFPIRLVLRLGAEFRYYPCPLVSVRNRAPLYTDIGHTIMNILADFRKYSYTLPSVRGLLIHMEDRQTSINIPRNRYDQVVRALNNSNDSVLAFGANMSLAADSHLVCMQSTEDENTSYHTQAINIHNKPRKVTGASFVVFNGALKVPGLAGKSNIVEDGLMVQVPSETMVALRTALRDMRDYSIGCGPNAEETVMIQWTADDTNFNIGVKSCIDGRALDGVPSIRVHNGTDYSGGMRVIRWTEVFILQCEDSEHSSEPLDISRLSESIARATCLALVPLLDLLSTASLTTLAVRTTIHPENVGYEAGSNGEKLPPLYMKSLDNELVAVVHQAALASQEYPVVLELVFRVMEQG